MPSQCVNLCQNLDLYLSNTRFSHRHHFLPPNSLYFHSNRRASGIFCNSYRRRTGIGERQRGKSGGGGAKVKNKENVWSVDNEQARAEAEAEQSRRRRKVGRRLNNLRKRSIKSGTMVSPAMLIEVETVLQTQEPVIRPLWSTFASSVSGTWKGVGAVFSPISAKMEVVGLGAKDEKMYDCYTLSHIEQVPSSNGLSSQIRRKINWVFLNPLGESNKVTKSSEKNQKAEKKLAYEIDSRGILPRFESFDFSHSDILEEDMMGMEPGLVFFEDGSYSRGPMDIPIGEYDESKYFLSPTFRFEQCLVKGCHKRLRIVHTIAFNEGGANVEITRVAVYEEKWVSPINFHDESDLDFDIKPFSQRKRTQVSDLDGSWKVFEVSATPIFGEETTLEEGRLPYEYLCMETLKRRSLPRAPTHFGEEEMDMQDVTVLWLPGGVTAYVDVKEDGILCIGVGWYSDEGINLVMERDYGTDGKLKEVRWKSEVKRRWSDEADHPTRA